MSNPLYKAKTHKGEWVYGYYYEQDDKAYILQDGKAYEVRKETRCQYLGEKEGIKLYEHDIIWCCTFTEWIEGQIIYLDDCFRFALINDEGESINIDDVSEVKVIDNKFD